jgi:protein-disulfide isomerase
MRQVRMFVALAAVVVFVPSVVEAQTQPAPATPMTQQQVNEEILRELRSIRMLLEKMSTVPQAAPQPQAPQRAFPTITNLKGYALGKPDAPLTMVEFTDLQCPYCREYVTVTFDEIKKNWIDTGKLRYISRDFPLDIHPFAMPAARAARCAGEQGKFWEMRMALMRNANLLSADYIKKTAADLKLDQKAFAACTGGTKYDGEITAELGEGLKIGVGGTPTFVIGKTTPDSVQGPMLIGALPYAAFDARLKELTAGREP